jgi:D-aminoacyl-tRNA deacylase
MRVILQRVTKASVTIEQKLYSEIEAGLLILVGVEDVDNEEDISWLCNKIINLRIFNDSMGVMNLSVKEISGELLVVSQFTLHASTKKGNRPSYIRASKPVISVPMYERFVETIGRESGLVVKTGVFGADMKVELLNDGPVTIWIDSKNKE